MPPSSILRIVCGLALVVLAYSTYQNAIVKAVPGSKLMLFGKAIDASAGQVSLALGVIGLIGAVIAALGVMGFLKGRQ